MSTDRSSALKGSQRVRHRRRSCYRCLYPEPPPPGLVPSCAEGGVLGILPGLVGVIQATETIKLILGQGDSAQSDVFCWSMPSHEVPRTQAAQDADCPVCGKNPTITKLIDYEEFCGIRGQEEPAEMTSRPSRSKS